MRQNSITIFYNEPLLSKNKQINLEEICYWRHFFLYFVQTFQAPIETTIMRLDVFMKYIAVGK